MCLISRRKDVMYIYTYIPGIIMPVGNFFWNFEKLRAAVLLRIYLSFDCSTDPKCGECGYGTRCPRRKCLCQFGFADLRKEKVNGQIVKYCFSKCMHTLSIIRMLHTACSLLLFTVREFKPGIGQKIRRFCQLSPYLRRVSVTTVHSHCSSKTICLSPVRSSYLHVTGEKVSQ